MVIIAAVLGGMGLTCILMRRTLLGILIGMQLLMLGAAMIFVMGDAEPSGHLVGLFITLSSLVQLSVGFALSARLFLLKKRAAVEEVSSLKH